MANACLLYYITDRTSLGPDEPTRHRRLLEKIAEATEANIDYIQLREKDLSTRELEYLAQEAAELITKMRTVNSELKTALLINSRADVALTAGAAGVHLRALDISPQEVRMAWAQTPRGMPAREPLIGVSCHSVDEVKQAESDGANFAVFAPVFEKKDAPGTQPQGLSKLTEACRAKIPVLALGGVTVANAGDCLRAGATGIAAIRLFQENRIADIAAKLRSL